MTMSFSEAILFIVAQRVKVSEVIFPSSLIGATIQDGSKRERRAELC